MRRFIRGRPLVHAPRTVLHPPALRCRLYAAPASPAPAAHDELAKDAAFLSAMDTPTSRYRQLIHNGTLRRDDHQKSIIEKLQKLNDELKGYQLPAIPSRSLSSSFGATSFVRTPLL